MEKFKVLIQEKSSLSFKTLDLDEQIKEPAEPETSASEHREGTFLEETFANNITELEEEQKELSKNKKLNKKRLKEIKTEIIEEQKALSQLRLQLMINNPELDYYGL